ncbi:MAG: 1-acyl-sn-glycerol-3-phosphate acyltransferase [Gammaproteobacteria bacterium]|nr:1-acyl-sn-glycerol-3-phosphate acyltransferase [Gammaproteobacteria bacterium]
MDQFKDIRPYQDDEIRPVLNALLKNRDFILSIARFYNPTLTRLLPFLVTHLATRRLKAQLKNVTSVATMQDVIAIYMDKMIGDTTTGLTHSGLDKLDHGKSYLFISNHRDITMDPAFVNYMLYHEDLETVQIAIGDNLLKEPFVTDLMRLNKSFIVRRSLKGRELLKALDLLSRYMHHCIEHNQNVWIAQREGRAKDGVDITDPALIKMLARGKKELPRGQSIANLHVVPIAISYEYDACDKLKAEELYQIKTTGKFEKTDQSDIHSIVTGMMGQKGHVHVAFGEELELDTDDPNEIASKIDAQILANYRLYDSNFLALELLEKSGEVDIPPLAEDARKRNINDSTREEFERRLANMDSGLHKYFLSMYANPVISRYKKG